MIRGQAALGVAVGLLMAACGSSTEGAAPKGPGTELFDGLTVVAGSHLVGPTFVEPAQAPDGERSVAVVSIDRDPVRVYDAYAEQARRAGFPIGGSGTIWSIGQPTCSFVFPGGPRTPFDAPEPKPLVPGSVAGSAARVGSDGPPPTTPTRTVAPVPAVTPARATAVACTGGTRRGDTTEALTIEVTWGTVGWSPPTRHGLLSAGAQPLFQPQALGDARVPTPTRLPRVTSHYATHPGEPFGTKNDGFNSGYRRFTLAAGSRVVAELPDVTVLSIDGNAHDVLREYANQLGQDGEPGDGRGMPPVQAARTSRGTVLTVENGPIGGGSARLLTDPSERWLLIRTSSD